MHTVSKVKTTFGSQSGPTTQSWSPAGTSFVKQSFSPLKLCRIFVWSCITCIMCHKTCGLNVGVVSAFAVQLQGAPASALSSYTIYAFLHLNDDYSYLLYCRKYSICEASIYMYIQHRVLSQHLTHFPETFKNMSLWSNLILISLPTKFKSLYLSLISVLNTTDKFTVFLTYLIHLTCFSCSMLCTCGLDTIYNTCQVLPFTLTSDSSHWAYGQLSPKLFMTASLQHSTANIQYGHGC